MTTNLRLLEVLDNLLIMCEYALADCTDLSDQAVDLRCSLADDYSTLLAISTFMEKVYDQLDNLKQALMDEGLSLLEERFREFDQIATAN